MFPFVSEGGEPVIASGDGGRRSGGNGSMKSHWALLRPLRW